MRRALLVVLLAACAPAAAEHTGHGQTSAPVAPSDSPFARDMTRGMEVMMRDMHAPGYSGNPDVDFLAMMIPHHEGAVEMARLVLVHGRDPLVRRLAEEIIAGQSAEIAAMRARLEVLRARADPEPGGYPALGSTRGQ